MTQQDDHQQDDSNQNTSQQDSSQQHDDLKAKLEAARKAEAENRQKEEDQIQQEDSNASETEKLQSELAKMTELAKRTMADMQNMKRRQEEERSQLVQMANASLVKSLLPTIDNLNRVADHITDEGLTMCLKNLDQTLIDAGLQPIETVGQSFNPDFHEAVQQGPGEKDIIIEEYERGYILGKRVIRHAKVMVGNGE